VSLLQSEPIAQQDGPLRPMMQYSELSQQTVAPTSKPAINQYIHRERKVVEKEYLHGC
jgi:hypothetical protein